MSNSTGIICQLLYASALLAQAPGTFVETGAMIVGRGNYSPTLLYNGKVLIAGGFQRVQDDPEVAVFISLAELYDPATGSFTPAGNMRSSHPTAVLLDDGRVLLAGGPSHTAEIYDPVAGTFSDTGEEAVENYGMMGARAVLLKSGLVFLAGYPTAQLYDPRTGKFSPTPPYAEALPAVLQSVTLLADGRVLLTGEDNICYQPLCADPGTSWAEIYDPLTATFSRAGKMNWWNSVYTATLMLNGKVLFTGGDTYNGKPSTAEVFDPADASFTTIDPPPAGHAYGSSTLMPDGSVLVTGGLIPGGQPQGASDLYEELSGSFSFAGRMLVPRVFNTSTLLPDGSILIASDGAPAELYRPARAVPAPSLSGGAIWHSASGQAVSAAAPASAGDFVSMYVENLAQESVISPRVVIGGRPAEILFFGDAPGYPGFSQVNVRVPEGIASADRVSVRVVYLGRASNEVTISVR